MRGLLSLGLAAGLLLLAACVPSLHPFFNDKDLTTDPALVGAWGETAEAKPKWTLKEDKDSGGYLVLDEQGTPLVEARLFKMGDLTFLDFAPRKDQPASGEANFLPVHTLARVWIEKDRLRLAFLNQDKFDALLKAHPDLIAQTRITYDKTKEAAIMVAPTSEVQAFVLKHLAELLNEPYELVRVKQNG